MPEIISREAAKDFFDNVLVDSKQLRYPHGTCVLKSEGIPGLERAISILWADVVSRLAADRTHDNVWESVMKRFDADNDRGTPFRTRAIREWHCNDEHLPGLISSCRAHLLRLPMPVSVDPQQAGATPETQCPGLKWAE